MILKEVKESPNLSLRHSAQHCDVMYSIENTVSNIVITMRGARRALEISCVCVSFVKCMPYV